MLKKSCWYSCPYQMGVPVCHSLSHSVTCVLAVKYICIIIIFMPSMFG